MIKKEGKLILGVLFALILIGSLVQAQELSLNINVDGSGEAFVFGSADNDPGIKGILFENKTLSGFTSELTSKQGGKWNFLIKSDKNYSNYYVKIKLPQGSKLLYYSGKPLISSEQGSLVLEYSEEGFLGIDLQYTLEKIKTEINWQNIISFIVLVVLVIIIIIILIRNQKKNKKLEKIVEKSLKNQKKGKDPKETLKDIRKVLNDRENQIIDLLLKEGKTTQGKLQKLSGIPKASFSRHLNNLAKKGVIHKEGSGKLNIVRLKIR